MPCAGSPGSRQRRYLTCCVRLSPEKEPLRFVDLVDGLAQLGVLERLQVHTFGSIAGRLQSQ